MITVLLFEDEIKTARELRKNIEQSPFDVVVIEVFQSIKRAVKWLKENPSPDLIFSDIQLADGLSFEIFRQVQVLCPIIFCTAFDEYAIDAFKANGIDYLLKPVDETKLAESLEKYYKMKQLFGTVETGSLPNLLHQIQPNYKKTILIHFQEKIIPLKTDDIAFIHYELGTIAITTFNLKKYFVSQTLDEWETTLNPSEFFRANRQFLIHRKAVDSIENYFSRRLLLKLQMAVPEPIVISKIKSPQLLKWIENL